MISIKSHIRRNFRPEHYPPGVCFVGNALLVKFHAVKLQGDEEVFVTIDNRPNSCEIDGVIFTSDRILILLNNEIKSIPWNQIEAYQLPTEKMGSGYAGDDFKMKRSDKADLYLKNGEVVTIRIIYGGIYSLATMFHQPMFHVLSLPSKRKQDEAQPKENLT